MSLVCLQVCVFAKQDLCLINVRYLAVLFVFSQRGQQPAGLICVCFSHVRMNDEILALVPTPTSASLVHPTGIEFGMLTLTCQEHQTDLMLGW